MRLPDFLVIGAQKAGTTAVHRYLEQHPGIFMCPVKESNFFAMEGLTVDFRGPGDREALTGSPLVRTITSVDEYSDLFRDARPDQVVGEACPMYLYDPGAPERIARHIPDVRLIAVLRNPIRRAFSAYMMLRQSGRERLASFEEALAMEPLRVERNWEYAWRYADVGRYARQLSRYYEHFPRENILVYLHEDLITRPAEVISEMLDFVGADSSYPVEVGERFNVSGIPRLRFVHRLLTSDNVLRKAGRRAVPTSVRQAAFRAVARLNAHRPEMSPVVERRLGESFRTEVVALSGLIDRDLSHWLPRAA